MLSHLDILAVSQTIQDFDQNNKEVINNLIAAGGGVALIAAVFNFINALKKGQRLRSIPAKTFVFKVIEPQSRHLKHRIFGGKYDDLFSRLQQHLSIDS